MTRPPHSSSASSEAPASAQRLSPDASSAVPTAAASQPQQQQPAPASAPRHGKSAPQPSELQRELDAHQSSGGGWWQWVLVLVMLGAAAYYLWGGGSHSGSHGEEATHQRGSGRGGPGGGRRGPQIIPVVVEQVRAGDIDNAVSCIASVTPINTVTLRSRVDGELTDVLYQEGQMVNKGDLLVKIDSRPYEVALAQAEGQLMRDQALLKNAKLDLERYQGLYKKDAIPQQTLTAQESTVAQYEGIVRTDQAVVDNAKLNLTYCNITAPISGRAGLRLVDQGNMVRAGDANGLVVITQLQPITLVFHVPLDMVQTVLARVHAGQTLRVEAWDSNLTTKLADGTLLTVDNAVNATSGTLQSKALYANKDLALYPNQPVNANLIIETKRNVTLVAPAAIQRGAASPYVFVLKPDNTVELREIQTGIATAMTVEVLRGLKPGETVVTAGVDKLQDGTKVTLGDPQAVDNAGAEPGNARSGGDGAPTPARGEGRRQGQGQGQGRRNRPAGEGATNAPAPTGESPNTPPPAATRPLTPAP
ncbi:multidrug transporter subunit MdtA [Verrucomicrobia bacterium LW23]|nr:multidrug transporter subunit MdtA [Verrucomicrobia bacterium LW23]